jgi:hypothetical protein
MMLGADERLKGLCCAPASRFWPFEALIRPKPPLLALDVMQMFTVCGKNLPQSQQCRSLLVGRLRHPKPFEFLDTRRHTGNMLRALLNMTFD